jgi:serine/threonine protein kinase
MDSSPTPSTSTPPSRAWSVFTETGAGVVGTVLGDRYQILRRIARGGMADVFLAKERDRRCYRAIKVLRSSSPDAVRRFELEAEVLSNIHHANIVRAIGFGRTPAEKPEDRRPYMVLEYLEGETLSERLGRGALPWREVAELGIQIAAAVHALHVAGVIHRDIKPHNIILAIGADRSTPTLIDLGLASVGAPFHDVQDARFVSQVAERRKTQLGHRIGTPAYLPPEAGLCEADPRLDVYSLGVTLYQLAAGVLPEPTGARPIREVCPGSDVPEGLSRLLLSALEPDADERLPSAEHLRRGLEAVLAAHPRTPSPTHLFGGSYDRLDVLGVGANAIVFRASDRWLSREVAVKVLRAAEPGDDDAIRFRRAAKILSALQHPNIPRILHFGIDGGQYFAVTELCSGQTASAFTRPDKHLRVDEVCEVGRQLGSALAAVHAAGIVYRDLHVGNVLIERGETPKAWLFDFDQSQVSPAFYARLTERYATPPEERVEPANERPLRRVDYAAPEVKAGGVCSPASDVFALGLLLYRLLTGFRPFFAEGGELTPARKMCPACPEGLERLLALMLEAEPRHRPSLAVVQDMLEGEFEQLAAGREAEDEQAERGAVAIEREAVPAADGLVARAVALAGETAPSTTTAPAVSEVAPVAPAEETAFSTTNDAPQASLTSRAPTRAVRARGLLLLACMIAAGFVLGRTTVSQEQQVQEPLSAVAASSENDNPAANMSSRTAAHEPPARAPDVSPVEREAVSSDDGFPTPNTLATRTGSGPEGLRPARPAVTSQEATAAARRAVAGLRRCEGIPPVVTADLDVARGFGVVTGLNTRAPTPDDPNFPWHACAQRELERVRFPVRETPARVRVRLELE